MKSYTYDNNLLLKDAGAVAASAAATVLSAAKVLDLGAGEVDGDIVIDVSAMDIVGNDEKYDIVAQLSSDAAFGTAGNIVERCEISLGAKETKITDCDRDDVVGRYILPFDNVVNGTPYRYLRIYIVEAGATSSINFTAFLAKK